MPLLCSEPPTSLTGILYTCIWFKESQQELHCWFNQDNAVSLHRGTYIIEKSYYVSLSHFGLKQNSSISITDARHCSISITDAHPSSISITDAQHSSISITDALGILLYNTLNHWFHSQESHLQQWFGIDSRKLKSHEWKWKSFPNPLKGEHKMVIHNHGKLCTVVFAMWDLRFTYWAPKLMSTSTAKSSSSLQFIRLLSPT